MQFLFDLLIVILVSSVFIFQYLKDKKKYTLLGIPLVIYCFVLIPLIQVKTNTSVTLIITLIVCIPLISIMYRGFKISKRKL